MVVFNRIAPFLILTFSVFTLLHENAFIFPSNSPEFTDPENRQCLPSGVLAERGVLRSIRHQEGFAQAR